MLNLSKWSLGALAGVLLFHSMLFAQDIEMLAAGTEVGNGGDGLVCFDEHGNISSVELLDFYEGRAYRGINREMGSSRLSFAQKVQYVLDRLRRVDPARAEKLGAGIVSFLGVESRFLAGVNLVDIPDSGHLFFPNGCRVVQVAIQHEPDIQGDARYVINKDLWDKMDDENRIGLALHELLYREALKYDHTNSIRVRYLNSVITSDQITTMTQKTYVNELRKSSFSEYSWMGVTAYFGTYTNVDEAMSFYSKEEGEGIKSFAFGNGSID
ncbi:hypothetical protein WDW86_06945 [Bdellovibrionota bacterium FG-2]